jgi:hypothetical protein
MKRSADFDRLTAYVIARNAIGLRACDLDEEALHAVVAEFERRDAAALAFALLELGQKTVGIAGNAAQPVKLCIVIRGDDTAVAHEVRRLRCDGAAQQRVLFRVLGDLAAQALEQRRIERLECCA